VAGVFADGAGCGLVCEIAALAVKSMMPSASCGRVTDMRFDYGLMVLRSR
jgi:hypothetical protein